MFVCISCRKNASKHVYIRYMLYTLGVEYVIVVADPELHDQYVFDHVTRVMTIRCADTYEGLPEKIVHTCLCIKAHFDPPYIVKIDDDVVLYNTSYVCEGYDYGGFPFTSHIHHEHKWHVGKCSDARYDTPFTMRDWYERCQLDAVEHTTYACGGSGYVLSRKAIDIIGSCDPKLYKTHMYEDILVGYLLSAHGVSCTTIILPAKRKRDKERGYNTNHECVMLKNTNIADHITPRYLTYAFDEGTGAGLNDRKAVIATLLVEARATNRIACIPHMKMSPGHNGNKRLTSCILNDYVIFDDPAYMYTLEPMPRDDIVRIRDTVSEEPVYVERHFPKGLWHGEAWNKYEERSHRLRNTSFKPIPEIKRIGDAVLSSLVGNGKLVGVHVRKGDRMSKEEIGRYTPAYIMDAVRTLGTYDTVYVASNEPDFTHEGFKTYRDFPELFSGIDDNYALFAVDMYIVEKCDVHVRTFKDSETLYHTSADTYYLIPRSMHIHADKARNAAYDQTGGPVLCECDFIGDIN